MSEMMVQFGGLWAAVTDMERSVGKLRTTFDQMETDIRPLTATWTGEAAVFYGQRQREWNEAFTELNAVLDTARKTVEGARENYMRAETANTHLWQT